ncbi:hypothetical protein CIB48_g8918 [Xylaria polymorpha]|nr:hypothetical protein CIB48_g8918 [Xylaria polymorpha]
MNQSISFLGSKAQRSSGTIEAWNGHQETGDSEIQGSRDRRDGVNSSTNDPDLTDDSDCSLLGSRIGFRDVHRNNLGRYFYPSGVLGAVAMPSSQFQTWGMPSWAPYEPETSGAQQFCTETSKPASASKR